MKAPFLIGSLLFGGFFVYSGINHPRNHRQMAPHAESKGVPKPEAGGDVVLNSADCRRSQPSTWNKTQIRRSRDSWIRCRSALVMRDFWRNEDPNERQINMINFMKSLGGRALALMGVEEPWEASGVVRAFAGS